MVLYNTIIETIYDEKNILKTNQKREPAMGRTFNEKSKLAIKSSESGRKKAFG